MRVSDYIIDQIWNLGIDSIFSVSGRGALFLTDAVAKHKRIRYVAVHHEQSASFAAVAYAQQSGKLGACLVSTGCASTNTITGVLTAWQDNIPCIFISGQNTLSETTNYTKLKIRTFGQQEADIIPIVSSITKYAVMITDPNDIGYELSKAIFLAQDGRPGPVWIDIPLDIQSAIIDPDSFTLFEPTPLSKIVSPRLLDDFHRLEAMLAHSQRPVIMIGSGVRTADSIPDLLKFVEQYRIPLVYAHSAPDTIGSSHELSIGSVGSMGTSRAGNFTLQNADLVIVLGNRLSSYVTGVEYKKFARAAKVVVIDIDVIEHSKNTIKIDLLIQADIRQFFSYFNHKQIKVNCSDWVRKCTHWKNLFAGLEREFDSKDKIDLYQLSKCLSENLPPYSSLVTDSGFIEVILPTNISFGMNQRCIHPSSQGVMGFALPGSIGTYFASNNTVVAVIGDGSIMMNLQELETIRHNQIPVKIIVINNNVYGIIRRRQKDIFRNRTIGTDPSNGVSCPDFKKLAETFDLKYMVINSADELDNGIKMLFDTEGPVMCEIIARLDQSYIEVGTTRNSNNKIVRRPLEDQAPFLDRSLFLSEMIVEPIDQ